MTPFSFLFQSKSGRSMKELFVIHKYKILETGNDGGHRYIETHIQYKSKSRRLTVFFESKLDENKLNTDVPVKVKGIIQDDGEEYGLLLRESELMND